jgi:drug/metabolite transporter (DMT)-like permease
LSVIPTIYAASLSSLFAAVLMAIILTIKKQWHEIKNIHAWKDILIMTFIIGVLYYLLYFTGLKTTTAGNASIIALMEVFFSMIILGLWKKEKQNAKSIIGGLLMVVGAVLVILKGGFIINQGDLFILMGAAIAPIGNYFQKSARQKVGSICILFIRSAISGLFLFCLALMFETPPTSSQLLNSLWFLFINGFVLFGLSKIFWIEAIHRITITKGNTLSAITPALTMVFAFFILKDTPTLWQIIGFIPIFLGIYIISELRNMKKIQ